MCRIREANYTFPLYDDVALISFQCTVGDDRLFGKIKPKSEAKAEYREAIAEERVAALFEEDSPEIFNILLGNVAQDSTVVVEIVYVGQLKTNFDAAIFTIPTSVVPKYEYAASPERPDNDNSGSLPMHIEGNLKINIKIVSIVLINKIESHTHRISSEVGLSNTCSDLAFSIEAAEYDLEKAHASFFDQKPTLEKDFVLTLNWNTISHALLDASFDQSRGPAIMLNI